MIWRVKGGRRWPAAGDGAVALVAAAVALWVSALAPGGVDLVGAGLVGVAAVSLWWRRVVPLAAVAGTGVVLVLFSALGYEMAVIPWAAWIALYSCMAVGSGRERVGGAVLAVGEVAGYLLVTPEETVRSAVGIVVTTVLAGVAGEAMRSRRAYAAELENKQRAARRERELAERQVLLEERARLARELHDALGHAVNVIVVQAGVAGRVFDANPEYGREALASIERTGRDALEELDSLIGLLGDPVGTGSLAELPAVLQRVRETGRTVDVTEAGDLANVPARVGRAAFQIVREAATNATRHAGPGRILVSMDASGSALRVEVRDEGGDVGPVAPGRGLVNMAERSRMVGGTFDAAPVPGGFRVRAVLPYGEAT